MDSPPKPQDNPFRSLGTIMRCVFDLFWLTWKDRREIAVCARRPGPGRFSGGGQRMKRLTTLAVLVGTLYDAAACEHLHRVATEIKRAGGDATRAAARRAGIYSIGG
jgi:hypothetical protein